MFISYADADDQFVLQLRTALEARGRNVWIDADDIPSGARWRQELGSAIEAADSFVFVITPASVASAECQTELARAVEVGKRLVPVLYRDAAGAPPELLTYQYVDARDGTGFDTTVDKVVAAIETDHDWVTAHTLWLGRALRWEESGRDRSTLLRRGKELRSAEEWLAGQSEDRKPPPTALQSAYIAESGRAERRRMRRLATAACIAVAVAVTLAVLALLQRSEAIAQRDEARSRELAAKAGQQLDVDPGAGHPPGAGGVAHRQDRRGRRRPPPGGQRVACPRRPRLARQRRHHHRLQS